MSLHPLHTLRQASLICLCACFTGCGRQNDFRTTPVQGVVTCNGIPVTSGTIVFSPVATQGVITGQPGAGPIGPDGAFKLTTYQDGDGAIIGTHSVSILPPAMTDDAKQLKSPCSNASVTIEVKAGEGQNMKIELSEL